MFDARLRRAVDPWIGRAATVLHRRSVGADTITGVGVALGLGAAAAAAVGWWWTALVLWLVSRVVDGLDGAVARIDGATARGGFLDIIADFTVYAAFVVAVAIQRPEARLAAVVLLATYYVSGAAFLAWSSLAAPSRADEGRIGGDRAGAQEDPAGADLRHHDDRSLRFVGGLTEGFETVVAYALVCIVPGRAATILWAFAALVGVTALQRMAFAARTLDTDPGGGGR